MALSYPDIAPSKYAKSALDFLKAKQNHQGAVTQQYFTVTVPSGTVVNKVVGLIPFRKGFSLNQAGTQLYVANIGDGSSTIDVGYVYEDSTYTSDPDAFGSALTTSAAGGLITFDEHAGLSFVAEADGWIAVTIGGSTTDADGVIKGQIAFTYDQA